MKADLQSNEHGLAEVGALLRDTIAEAKKLLDGFRVAPATRREKLLTLIVAYDILRKAQSVEAMVTVKAYAGVNVIVRSAFESYVDVLNLLRDPGNYPDYLIYLSWDQQRSLLEALIADPGSAYTASLKAESVAGYNLTAEETLQQLKQDMQNTAAALPKKFRVVDKHGNQKGVVTSVKHRFKLADQEREYDAVYRQLSNNVHGRLAVMLDGIRHGDSSIVWPPRAQSGSVMGADLMWVFLLDTVHRLAKKYDKPRAVLKQLVKRHTELLKQIVAAKAEVQP